MSFFESLIRFVSFLLLVVMFGACERQASEQVSTPKPQVDLAALRAKAEQGDALSQAQLGRLYLKGEVVTNSYNEAAKWFQLAAEKGNSDAEAGLGELYEAGQGVPQDMKKALLYYRQAADKGHAGAQYTLGFMAECGRGLPQNHAEAVNWFLKAAEQDEPLSQYDLGQRYEKGIGVNVDLAESYKWLTLAAARNQPDAIVLLDQVRKKMSAEEIAEAKRRVAAFRIAKSEGAPGTRSIKAP
jgi:TPR repeat protein